MKILLATGGTGGHIFPCLALRDELEKRGHIVKIAVDKNFAKFGDIDGQNIILVPSTKIGSGFLGKLKFLSVSYLGVLKALWMMLIFNPQKIVVFGGYSSFPVGVVSVLFGKELIVHEQNAVIGAANEFFARFAKKIALSFRNTLRIKESQKKKTHFTGNPVRVDVLEAKSKRKHKKFQIFVMGGSLGAKIMSSVVPSSINSLNDKNICIIHQARADDIEQVKAIYEAVGIEYEVQSFFKDVGKLMLESDLIIARSGATTIAELLALNKYAILVPIKNSARNHQLYNAIEFSKTGNGIYIEEDDFKEENLAQAIRKIKENPPKLNSATNFNAAQKLAELVEK